MPRRTAKQAGLTALKQELTRFRFLLRNPQFQNDLQAARGSNDLDAVFELLKKWGLQEIPMALVWGKQGQAVPAVPNECEAVLIKAIKDSIHDMPDWEEHLPWRPAVLTHDPLDPYDENSPTLALNDPRRNIVQLSIDVSYPLDVLEELIRKELKKVRARRTSGKAKATARRRKRLDKTDFYLKVYDLARQNWTFSMIAKRLRPSVDKPIPVSTVKSAYLAAAVLIHGLTPVTGKSPSPVTIPSKKGVVLEGFDPFGHAPKCAICSKAQSAEEMCLLARSHAGELYESQREIPVGGTSELDQVIKGRKKRRYGGRAEDDTPTEALNDGDQE